MTLRPYQETAVRSALGSINKAGSAVLQMPTGAGKTRAATAIIQEYNGTVWFICHRQEIERQASSAFSAAGIDHGIVSPRAKPDFTKRVQIVSVAAKCLAEMPQPSLVIWDECHHVPAKSWAKLHASLPDAKHLGLTATPERLDGKGLKDWFAELIVGPSISELIEQGFLSPVRYFAPSDPDLTAAKLQAGDYRRKDADAVMNSRVIIGDAVAEYRRSADGKRAIAFCTSVEASKALVDRFNDEGIPAMHVDGASSDDHRRDAIAALTSGEVKVLSNVEVFTEGFDVPVVEAVILMRPTKSATLLLQMIGRALRPVEGKTAIIMDHAGLHQDHGWFASDWQWSIEGGAAKARRLAGARGPRRCPECKEVRGERLPVCECGYEFPTGREIGEFDGVLREVRGAVPEGWETLSAFGRRIGRSPSGTKLLAARGMPSNGNLIHIEEARLWLRANPLRGMPPTDVDDPHEYVSPKTFAKEIGVSESSIKRLSDKGLPRAGNGWVHRRLGLEFIQTYESSHSSLGVKKEGEFVPVTHFAIMAGVSAPTVNWCISQGMPAASNNWVNPGEANAWMMTNFRSNKVRPFDVDDPHNYEVGPKFAARFGLGSSAVNNWRRRGLPCASNGWVNVPLGIDWVAHNIDPKLIPPQNVSNPSEYEKPTLFERRVGAKEGASARWRTIRRAENGWIHIEDGLAWHAEYKKHPRNHGKFSAEEGSEPLIYFANRIGFKTRKTFESGKLKSIPREQNGWVHIQRGLEWVRDNTNIEIPQSAWPSANDNNAAQDNEAAA